MEAKLLSESCSIVEKAQVFSSLRFTTHGTAAEANIFQLLFSGRRLNQRRTAARWQPTVSFMPVTSPIGWRGDRDPFYEPYIGKVDVGTLRHDSFTRPCEIIFRRACILPFHHRKSVAILHTPWRARDMQLRRLRLLALPIFGPRAARSGNGCLQTSYLCRSVRVS